MISRSVRFHLSKGVSKNEKDVFSLKYLRISSVTKMAANGGVNFFESHAHYGYIIGTNQ